MRLAWAMAGWLLFAFAPGAPAAQAAGVAPEAVIGTSSSVDEVLSLRDPFKRPEALLSRIVPKGTLELFPVDSFKMVGVLTGPDRFRAMVLAPDGKTYTVRVGTKIGTRSGMVLRVSTSAIEVRERIINVLGREENVDTRLGLLPETKSEQASTKADYR